MRIRYTCKNRKTETGKANSFDNKRGSSVIRATALGVALAVAPSLMGCGNKDMKKDDIVQLKKDNADYTGSELGNGFEKRRATWKLEDAARSGDIEKAKKAIAEGADMEEKSVADWERTPLLMALREGRVEFAEFLIEQGADIKSVDKDGSNALLLAARYGNKELIEKLIDKGLDIHEKNKYGETALHLACGIGNMETMKVLIENGADVNGQTNNGMTPLMYAARTGEVDVVKLMIEKGADAKIKSTSGWTPLMSLAQNDELVNCLAALDCEGCETQEDMEKYMAYEIEQAMEISEILIENGADVNSIDEFLGFTALSLVKSNFICGRDSVAKVLKKHGAREITKKERQEYKNKRTLYDAIQFDNLEQLKYIIDNIEGGANARYKHYNGGCTTALEYACLNSSPKAAEFLIENGAEITDDAVNLVLTNNMTSVGDVAVYNIMMKHAPEKMVEGQKKIDAEKKLISAAWDGDIEKLKEMVDKVYDINARDANGENALSISCFMGNFDAVKFLVNNGAEIDSWAIQTAITASNYTIFEYLINKCDKKLLEGRSGGDLLIDAAIKGNHKMVKALLDAGADVNYQDSQGNTALSVAIQLGEGTIYYEETIRLLKEAGTKA